MSLILIKPDKSMATDAFYRFHFGSYVSVAERSSTHRFPTQMCNWFGIYSMLAFGVDCESMQLDGKMDADRPGTLELAVHATRAFSYWSCLVSV